MNRIKYILAIVLLFHCSMNDGLAGGSSDTETGTITGQVIYRDSVGIAGALVGIQSVSPLDSPSVSAVLAGGRQTTTDSNGFFSFPLVSTGDYAVAAKAFDSLTGLARVNVAAGDTAHAVISVDLRIFPMLYKCWILTEIHADTGIAQDNPFDTVFAADASPEILCLSPMNSTYGYCRRSDTCTEIGGGPLAIGATTLRFDTAAPCVFHFKSPYDTLAIETFWSINGRDVASVKYYRMYQGPLPPSGWPPALCQSEGQTNAGLRMLNGKALEPDGMPVAGQMIQIVSTGPLMPYPVATDSGGNFRFFVPPGTYTLKMPWGPFPGYSPPPLMVFDGIRPDIATDTQVVIPATALSVDFAYRMYPRDTVIRGTIIDTIGPDYGIFPKFPLWVELATGDSSYMPVSDTVSGAGEFTIRVSSHFPLYRLRWGTYRCDVPSYHGALWLAGSDSTGIAPGTTGIRLTVIKLN